MIWLKHCLVCESQRVCVFAKADSFLDTLNPIIMLLDPDLHTFNYVRERSRFL